jgi:6-pyruvoyltetrahydropterin/6-carboxytetrahydropterin synthase
MAYNITVESYFSAAHRLRGYRGKCENLHGHNWKVSATISSDMLDKTGMVFDFKKAKSVLEKILGALDHKQLNEVSYFKKANPTSEQIAEFIFREFKKKLRRRLNLKSVSVWETPTSSATFSEDI